MPRRKILPKDNLVVDPSISLRFPNLFASDRGAEVLEHPEWQLLLADLQKWVEDLSYRLVHQLPEGENARLEQAFWRGKVAVFEDLIFLKEEYQKWKAGEKK